MSALHSVHSSTTYRDAEHAVDWLSDHEFPVERVSIVGTGLRYVERVSGRMTTGRATLLGTGYGALVGLLWGLLFAALFTFDSGSFWSLLGFSILVGGVGGAIIGALSHSSRGGSATSPPRRRPAPTTTRSRSRTTTPPGRSASSRPCPPTELLTPGGGRPVPRPPPLSG
jgi:heat induced stress protein YflT